MINRKLSPMEALLKARANSKLRPVSSTLNAAKKLPDSYSQKRAAARGVISREEIADLLRNARAEKDFSANLKPALRELAARSGRIVEFGAVDQTMRYFRLPSMKGASKAQMRQHYEIMRDTAWGQTAVDPKQASKWQKGIYNARENEALSSHNRSNKKAEEMLLPGKRRGHLAELAARSGRIVEFGDGEADEAVLTALKAVASADESSAQRAMLLKRGLIEMVKGQVVITERGYEMMQKAGVPPKLTPEERREEIAGTEEKRLSRFNHGEHGGHLRPEWLR